jgi:isoleucyl-tRNA synthetase
LGNLSGFTAAEKVPAEQMPELERYVLHRLWQLDKQIREACTSYDFHGLFNELHNFCAVDLSAFYFDVRKDSLYCDAPTDLRRRACRTVLDTAYNCLVTWMAPFICFTAEEAWLARFPGDDSSVHLQTFPEIPGTWKNDALAAKWQAVRDVRRVVTGAIEVERAAKRMGASLQAHPHVFAPAETVALLRDVPMDDVCITSAIAITASAPPEGAYTVPDVANIGVKVELASGDKCLRCWKVLPEVGKHKHAMVCERCSDAIDTLPQAAA